MKFYEGGEVDWFSPFNIDLGEGTRLGGEGYLCLN